MSELDAHKPNPMNHAMFAGLEMGLWFGVNFIITTQQLRHGWLVVVGWLVTAYIIWGLIVSLQHYKSTECGGKISFGHAYGYVLCLFVCSSLVAAVIRFAYLMWFDQAYLPTIYATFMETVGGALPKYAEFLENNHFSDFFTPIRYTFSSIFGDVFNGVFFGPLLALFTSRRNLPYFDDKIDN